MAVAEPDLLEGATYAQNLNQVIVIGRAGGLVTGGLGKTIDKLFFGFEKPKTNDLQPNPQQ